MRKLRDLINPWTCQLRDTPNNQNMVSRLRNCIFFLSSNNIITIPGNSRHFFDTTTFSVEFWMEVVDRFVTE